jgi:thioredoxin reductase (NADPH)
MTNNVVIIGSGPAGWTAALYTGRANLKPVIFEGSVPNIPGGQLMITSDVENFPGFPEGVTGPELMERMKKQAERFGAVVKSENITKVDFSKHPYTVTSESGETVQANAILIATGANAKLLGIAKEGELMKTGAGVSACATCDGALYKNEELAVVGGGDTAMEEASFLTKFASKVTIVHRRDAFRASKVMQDRVFANEKIEVLWNTVLDEIVGGDAVTGAVARDVVTGETRTIATDGVFMAIGHDPTTALFRDQLPVDDDGYLVVHEPSTETGVPGVFAAGDVTDHTYRQAVTAAGQGCKAAIDAERLLTEEAQ